MVCTCSGGCTTWICTGLPAPISAVFRAPVYTEPSSVFTTNNRVLSTLATFDQSTDAVPSMFARDNTDRLTMNNGDSMTCEIKGLDGGVLYVSFDYIDGTSSVDWSKVASVESTRLFVVKAEDGSVYTGALKTAGMGADRPLQIHVLQPSEQ